MTCKLFFISPSLVLAMPHYVADVLAGSGCTHQFCWLCGGPWNEHTKCASGYYLSVG